MTAAKREPVIVIFGAGAVGGSVAGWLAPYHAELYVVDLPKNVEMLRRDGITTYVTSNSGNSGDRQGKQNVAVKAVASLAQAPKPDYILMCVKTYSLDGVCKHVREQVGADVTVVGLQNGVENQRIIPKYFKKAIFGIVAYNAWIDEPGVIGAQKRGPLVLGTLDGAAASEVTEIAEVLNLGVKTVVTDRLADAAHSKMIVNLTNSLTTLVGLGFRELTDRALFQKLLSHLTAEGVEIVRAAGFHEVPMDGMPSWRLMRAAAVLPGFLTRPVFNRNLRKMVVSSMAQDVLQRGSTDSELEYLNGYFVGLADKHGVKAPYNRAIYELCRENFGQPGFQPLDVRAVWERVRARL